MNLKTCGKVFNDRRINSQLTFAPGTAKYFLLPIECLPNLRNSPFILNQMVHEVVCGFLLLSLQDFVKILGLWGFD